LQAVEYKLASTKPVDLTYYTRKSGFEENFKSMTLKSPFLLWRKGFRFRKTNLFWV